MRKLFEQHPLKGLLIDTLDLNETNNAYKVFVDVFGDWAIPVTDFILDGLTEEDIEEVANKYNMELVHLDDDYYLFEKYNN